MVNFMSTGAPQDSNLEPPFTKSFQRAGLTDVPPNTTPTRETLKKVLWGLASGLGAGLFIATVLTIASRESSANESEKPRDE